MLLPFALLLAAADLNGIWNGYILNRQGDKIDVNLKLTQTGNLIGGKLYGDYKSSPVIEGIVVGDTVNFVVLAEEQQGNQINESRIRFEGKFVNDNELVLNRQRERSSSAGNSGNAATKATPDPKVEIRLKRLL
ncbi:hypothetical protein F183_A00910 [Bryobacterales bacterium F-183]|nr:hypothetical protein F183_A00910 [Bryobacterales bacterium F-183]